MSMIFIGVGTAHMGVTRKDKDGNIVAREAPRWECDPDGGSVAIGRLDPETMEQDGPADVFGDWDAAGYLSKVLELLHPSRPINIPDLKSILKAAAEDGDEDLLCRYCSSINCRTCIVKEWREDGE